MTTPKLDRYTLEKAAEIERLAVEAVCSSQGVHQPQTVFEHNMVKLLKDFGLKVAASLPQSWQNLMDEAGKFFDWGNAAGIVLRNLLDAYERRIRSLCATPEQLATKPWECAEFVEARLILDAKPNWVVTVDSVQPPAPAPVKEDKVPEGKSMNMGFLVRLLDDIQNNAAIGEPDWSDISDRIWQARAMLAATPASGKGEKC